MNTTVKTCGQWAIFSTLLLVGFIAFMVVAGEEDPANPMSFGRFVLLKGAALAVLALCVWGGKWLHRHGCFPEYIDRELKEAEEDC